MGGLAAVVAAGIIALVFMQAFSTYYSTSIQSSNLLLQSMNEQAQHLEQSIHESLSLSNLTLVNSSAILFLASNTGTISIPASDFHQMDVFLQYSVNSSLIYHRISYQPLGSSPNSWKVVSVTTESGRPESIDPISLPGATSGSWDPGEVLHILILLNSPMSNSTGFTVVSCTPAAVCGSGSA